MIPTPEEMGMPAGQLAGWISAIAVGITTVGVGVMKIAKASASDRKDMAVDNAAKGVFDLLSSENARMSKQLGELSALIQEGTQDRARLQQRIAVTERMQETLLEVEKENLQLKEQLAAQSARIEGLLRQQSTERDDLRAKIDALEQENATLKSKVSALELHNGQISNSIGPIL